MACRRRDEAGYVTPAFVACVGLTVLLLVAVANLYVVHYARGVMQAAVEEGARQGLAAGDLGLCAARADAAVHSGLGAMSGQVGRASCAVGADGVTAVLEAAFQPWLPGVPVGEVTTRALVTGRTAP